MRKCLAVAAVFACFLFSSIGHAQVPEAHGTCVSGCGSSGSGSGSSYNPYAARSAARLADQRKVFDKVKNNDEHAAKKARDLFHKGRDEESKGAQCKAADDFQRALSTIQSSNVSTPDGIWDGPLQGEYVKLQVRQNENARVINNHLVPSQAECMQLQARNQVQASAAAPANNAPQAPMNFRVDSVGNGVNSCYRADPEKVSCLELRNNSERRVRMYIDGMPGVQCTIEPHSYCSLPMAIGHLQLRMAADDDKGAGPIVGAEVDIASTGTRLNLAAAN